VRRGALFPPGPKSPSSSSSSLLTPLGTKTRRWHGDVRQSFLARETLRSQARRVSSICHLRLLLDSRYIRPIRTRMTTMEDSRRFRRRRSSRNADTYRRSLETLSTLSTLSPCRNRNMTPEAHWRASASRYLRCDSSSQRPLTLGLVLSRTCRYQPSDLGNSGDGRRENLVFFQIERHVHCSTHKHTF
jgi:hypothetical protein